jgi:uncharacterized protein YkwD
MPADLQTARHSWRSLGPARAPFLICLIGIVCPSPAPAQTPGEFTVERAVSELHDLVNTQREALGCKALLWHEPTARVAEAHSADMSARDFFDHFTPEGTDLYRRLLAGGVTWRGSIGENIALTSQGPEIVIELWMQSPPHRANILNCTFTHEGLGLFRDRWTQVLIERPGG